MTISKSIHTTFRVRDSRFQKLLKLTLNLRLMQNLSSAQTATKQNTWSLVNEIMKESSKNDIDPPCVHATDCQDGSVQLELNGCSLTAIPEAPSR